MNDAESKPVDQPASEPADEPTPSSPRRRFGGRHTSAAVIGVLTLLLGFAIVVQVRAHSSSDSLSGLREDDLVGILDDQNARAERLRQQLGQLQDNLRQLRDSGSRSAAARRQAAEQARTLGILLGTVPARGPGVLVSVTDPDDKVDGEGLLDVVEELRGAGAEAIQVGPVRISTSSAFTGDAGAVRCDGTALQQPYRFVAIGDAKTLDTALNIPGGVADTVRSAGGELTVTQRSLVDVTATRALPPTKYAKPTR